MSVAARATSIAARAKPSIGGVLVLAAIATVPWVEQHRRQDDAPIIAATASPEPGFEPDAPRIVFLDHVDSSWAAPAIDVLVPPHIRDAEPYPIGMVMGMNTPSVDPGILVWDGSPLANMLSVILAPWRALAGLRGT